MNNENYSLWNLVETAIKEENLEEVKKLVEKFNDINDKDKYGRTVLSYAVCRNDLDIVKYLVEEKGAEINYIDNYNFTPLQRAIINSDNIEIIKYLIKMEAYVNPHTDKSLPPLISAIINGNNYIADYLIKNGANIDTKDNGETPLIVAIKFDNMDMVKLLIECRADINTQDDNGKTALMHAVRYGNTEMVELLLKGEIDLDIKDNKGMTALDIAIDNDYKYLIKCIKEKMGI